MGSISSYNFTLSNKNESRGIGQIVVVFRPPSCYQMNFDQLETLRISSSEFEDFEFKDFNTQAWLYFKGLAPG